ncbi:MAG: ECF transporter S component [Clostridia bacterium]|nr:ECF transporter S component [Clostridia bacterium]
MRYGKVISIICIALIPVVIVAGFFTKWERQYYYTAAAVLLLSLIPFLISLERRRLKARELVTLASLTAIAVASRAAFYAVPQVKPMCALLIIIAVSIGPQFGFTVGALAALVSNFIFGQGAWTPFQMFAAGLTAAICAVCFYGKRRNGRILPVAIVGGLVTFAVYGFIVDTCAVLMMAESFTLSGMLSVYASGIPFNLIHGGTSFLIILLLGSVMRDTIERVIIKYDLFGGAGI